MILINNQRVFMNIGYIDLQPNGQLNIFINHSVRSDILPSMNTFQRNGKKAFHAFLIKFLWETANKMQPPYKIKSQTTFGSDGLHLLERKIDDLELRKKIK